MSHRCGRSLTMMALLMLLATVSSCTPASSPGSDARQRTYRNPVFDHDAPDPTVIRADGRYYAYTTQSVYLDLVEIPILVSRDLVRWRQVGDAFPSAPEWVVGGAAGDMWAPHITYWRGRYLLYYAARRASAGDMAIGVAVATRPRGPFTDLGHPLLTRQPGQPPYTAIDPFVFAQEGSLYLYWGSNDQPIRVAKLSPDGLRVVGRPHDLLQPVPMSGRYGGLVEGPWVLAHGGWLYLMYSVGDCCSERANYSVFVARSKSPLGPFVPGPANPILHANKHFWAVGHNATVRDSKGRDWVVYHARVRGSFSDDRDLMIDRIVWRNGWPTVNRGAGPSWKAEPAPATSQR